MTTIDDEGQTSDGTGNRTCMCKVCTRSDRWLAALKPKSPEAKAAMEEIESLLEDAETSATYWEMKFKGTWGVPASQSDGGSEHGR